jgi:hypothetical protein
MSDKNKLKELKALDLSTLNASLAVVREYKKDRVSQYTVRYVPIDSKLQKRLRGIVTKHIQESNTVEEYTYDCPEPEDDQVRSIDSSATDFHRVFEELVKLDTEEDTIDGVAELVKSKAYMIVLRDKEGIRVIGYKILPENWKMKRSKGLIPLLYTGKRFEDLEQENVFSISSTVDMLYYDDMLFILSKRAFEQGMNFREGMLKNADLLYQEVTEIQLFTDIGLLQERVGNNQRYLKKVATIRNLGHYRNKTFLQRLRDLSLAKGWSIVFENDQMVINDANLDDVLTVLQNKRLHSELTDEDFDVNNAKPLDLTA